MKHRRGDAWDYIGQAQIKDLNGVLVNATGFAIRSEIRASPSGALLATAACAWIDPVAQTFSHKVTDTSAWPVGSAVVDVVIVNTDGGEISSDSARFDVVARVTA